MNIKLVPAKGSCLAKAVAAKPNRPQGLKPDIIFATSRHD
jgi:hypothetical protein